jgi:hypothetical protein
VQLTVVVDQDGFVPAQVTASTPQPEDTIG